MDGIAKAWAWCLENWGVVLTGLYVTANLVVAATPNKSDDRALARVMGALSGALSAGLFGNARLPRAITKAQAEAVVASVPPPAPGGES